MMKRTFFSTLFVLGLCLCNAASFANELQLGRAKIVFDSANWKSATAQDKGIDYSGDIRGTINSDSRIFINEPSNGIPDAIVISRGSLGGISGGYMEYSPSCPSSGTLFADGNAGHSRNFAQCLRVFGFVDPGSLLKLLPADQQEILKNQFAKWQGPVRPITVYYANSTGTFLYMLVLLSPKATGFAGPASDLKEDFNAEQSIAWGKNLMQNLKGSVMSISGRMTFPSLDSLSKPTIK